MHPFEWLDDLVWAYGRFEVGCDANNLSNSEKRRYLKLLSEEIERIQRILKTRQPKRLISGVELSDLCKAYRFRSEADGPMEKLFPFDVGESWLLRKSINALAGPENSLSERLLAEYLQTDIDPYSTDSEEWVSVTKFVDSKEFPKLCDHLQRIIRYRVSDKKIVVETCPSSNLVVSGLRGKYENHPIFSLYPIEKEKTGAAPNVLVSVNSDDPIIFAADVIDEYIGLGAAASRNPRRRDGPAEWDKRVEEWMKELIRMGYNSRFHSDRL